MTVKLNGSSSGSVALDAPASTTGGADVVFKLPVADGTAGQVLSTDGSGNLSWVSAGINEVDQWRVHTDFAGWVSAAIVSSNWERCDNAPTLSKIGTGMSESSGIFTFPSTGIWQIYTDWSFNTHDEVRYNGVNIYATTDNSSYSQVTANYGSSVHDSGNLVYGHVHSIAIVDITDVSNQKVAMYLNSEAGNNTNWIGNTGKNENVTTFVKLAET